MGGIKPLSEKEMRQLGFDQHGNYRPGKPSQRKGVTKWLPAAGAVAGGLAAAPFTGGGSLLASLAFLGAGSAVGSAVGERAAQQRNREQFNAARIGKEAAVGGITGAIPLGGFARNAKVASQVGSDLAAPAVTKGVGASISNMGRRLETRSGGFGIGEKFTGKAPVDIGAQRKITATLKAERIKPGHPEDQAINAQRRLEQYHAKMDAALSKTNRPLSLKERKQITTDYLKKVNASPTVDSAVRKNALEFANNFVKQTKDLKSVNSFRRAVDKDAINYVANPDAAVAAKQQAAQLLRGHLSETVGKLAPEVKAVNTQYAKLSHANDYLTQQAGRLTRQSENAGGGITGRVLTGDTAQTFKSKSGRALTRVGDTITGGAPGTASSTGRASLTEALKQAAARPIDNTIEGYGQGEVLNPNNIGYPEEDPYASQAPQDTVTAEDGSSVDPSFYDQQGDPSSQDPNQQVQGPATLEDALMQAQQILGDGQTPATYLSYAKAIQAGSKSNANQQKTAMALQNARNVVDELTQAYKQVGGPQGAGTGQVRNVLGKARVDQQARNYNDLRQAFLSRIARAFGEVGTLNEGDINRALGAIPDLADNRQTAARKLAILNNLLAKAQQNNSGGSSNADLIEAMLQAQQ